MKKYLVVLTAPSMHFMSDPINHTKAYVVEAEDNTIGEYVDERLMRKFALDYKVKLSEVRILAAGLLRNA